MYIRKTLLQHVLVKTHHPQFAMMQGGEGNQFALITNTAQAQEHSPLCIYNHNKSLNIQFHTQEELTTNHKNYNFIMYK